jgi:hypothetical protein
MEPRLHRWVMIEVTRKCFALLRRWRDSTFLLHGVPLGSVPVRREVVTTDTSSHGLGAVWQKRSVQGVWCPQWRGQYLNVLELRTVYLALKLPQEQTCARPHKQPRRDLVTGVPEGSPETMDMGSSSVGLLEGNAPPRQTISVGDYLSRQRLPPGEWRLHPQVVQMIWDRYGRPR